VCHAVVTFPDVAASKFPNYPDCALRRATL